MVWTDPPYNVNYPNTAKDRLRKTYRPILNDHLDATRFDNLLRDALSNLLHRCKGAVYIG